MENKNTDKKQELSKLKKQNLINPKKNKELPLEDKLADITKYKASKKEPSNKKLSSEEFLSDRHIKTFKTFLKESTVNEFLENNNGLIGVELSISFRNRTISGKIEDVKNDRLYLKYKDSAQIERTFEIVYDENKFWNAKHHNQEVFPNSKYDEQILLKFAGLS